jgi:glycosyltransferase involved in cell wall biosynthesis
VALVTHDIHARGGMERVSAELIRRAARDIDFVVISNTLSEDLRRLVEWRRVPLIERPMPVKFAQFYLAAPRAIRQAGADLVHTVGAIVPNHADLVTVHHCHAAVRECTGLAPPGLSLARWANTAITTALSIRAERRRYRPGRARLLAAVSSGVGQELARHYHGVPVAITPNGVDGERFAPAPDAREDLRREEGVGAHDVVALFLGGDWHRKGLAVAIRGLAAAQLKPAGRLQLWVVGRGDQPRFAALARASGVGDRVRFFGQPAEVERFYQAADIFVLPSLYEGFSLVALEAAACGLPVVATRVGFIEELVGEEEAGLIVPRTPAAVGTALTRLAADPALRARQGAVGRRRAQSYTWGRSAHGVLDLYEKLLGAGRLASGIAP